MPKTEPRTCPACGTAYLADPARLRFGRQTFCSRACSYSGRGEAKRKRVSVICSVCQAQFSRSPANIKGKHGGVFCSRACHYAGRSTGASRRVVIRPYVVSDAGRAAWALGAAKTVATRRLRDNYRHSDATRAKLAEATARQIARSHRSFGSSKLEDIVAAHLCDLGVPFDRQRWIRDTVTGRIVGVVDFWLPNLNVGIEVNGTYWHCDPRVYPKPTGDVQVRAVARYQRKLEHLARLGVRIVELWEKDVRQSPAYAVLRACQKAASR